MPFAADQRKPRDPLRVRSGRLSNGGLERERERPSDEGVSGDFGELFRITYTGEPTRGTGNQASSESRKRRCVKGEHQPQASQRCSYAPREARAKKPEPPIHFVRLTEGFYDTATHRSQ